MSRCRLKILDRSWSIGVLTAHQFKLRFDQEDDGITLPETRQMYIHEEALNLATIKHELIHAYYDGLCLSSAMLTTEQQEEVFAELLATYGSIIMSQARSILKELK